MAMKVTLSDFLGTEEAIKHDWELISSKMTLDFLADVFVRMKELGIKQKDLAKAMGVTPAAVSKQLSNGSNPRFSTVAKLAEALGCDVVAPKLVPLDDKPYHASAEPVSPQIQVVVAAHEEAVDKRANRVYELQ